GDPLEQEGLVSTEGGLDRAEGLRLLRGRFGRGAAAEVLRLPSRVRRKPHHALGLERPQKWGDLSQLAAEVFHVQGASRLHQPLDDRRLPRRPPHRLSGCLGRECERGAVGERGAFADRLPLEELRGEGGPHRLPEGVEVVVGGEAQEGEEIGGKDGLPVEDGTDLPQLARRRLARRSQGEGDRLAPTEGDEEAAARLERARILRRIGEGAVDGSGDGDLDEHRLTIPAAAALRPGGEGSRLPRPWSRESASVSCLRRGWALDSSPRRSRSPRSFCRSSIRRPFSTSWRKRRTPASRT